MRKKPNSDEAMAIPANHIGAQSRIEALTDWNPNPIIELNEKKKILYTNPAAKIKFPDLHDRGSQHPALAGLSSVIDEFLNSTSEFIVFEQEILVGEACYEVQVFAFPKNCRMYIFMIDTTKRMQALQERRDLEEQLFQSQKMEALGQLSSGIAHDFNNILTSIQGNLQLLQQEAVPNTKEMKRILAALKATERAADLSKRLLSFAKRSDMEVKSISLPEFMKDMENLIKPAIGKHIDLTLSVKQPIWKISVDVNQLENALLNIAVNARDAMDLHGKLNIIAENIILTENDYHKDKFVRPGDYVRISISDSGIGIKKEILTRIFDPFFTTKLLGTGLGLSQVNSFVRQSKGYVMIDTEEGQGTTVHLYLPRV